MKAGPYSFAVARGVQSTAVLGQLPCTHERHFMERHTTLHRLGSLLVAGWLASACTFPIGEPQPAALEIGARSENLRILPPVGVDDVLLVHGAWADGSSWSAVIAELQRSGYKPRAVQLRLQSLTDDAEIVRHAIDQNEGPLVVVGHSYGGFVMSQAATGAENVAALVFVAAFAPDEGESLAALTTGHETPTLANLVVDDKGEAIIEPNAFVDYFAPDIPTREARVLAAVQAPTAFGILAETAGPPAWRAVPSYFHIALEDQVIAPLLQQMFAKRMDASTVEVNASHVSLISRARSVAAMVSRAARANH